jgi:hypothetical protein
VTQARKSGTAVRGASSHHDREAVLAASSLVALTGVAHHDAAQTEIDLVVAVLAIPVGLFSAGSKA